MDLPSCKAFHTSKVPSPHSSSQAKGEAVLCDWIPVPRQPALFSLGLGHGKLEKMSNMNSNHPEVEFVHYFPGYLLSPSSSTEGTSFGGNRSPVILPSPLLTPLLPCLLPTPRPFTPQLRGEGPVPNSVSRWMAGWGPARQASLGTEGQPEGLDPSRKFSSESARELRSLCCGTHARVSTAPDRFSVLMPS